MRHAFRGLLLLAILAALSGCSSTVRRPLYVEPREPRDPLRTRGGVEIVGYTSSDGVSHPYLGRARLAGDSLQFLSRDDIRHWDSVAREPEGDPELLWVSSPPDVAALHVSRISFWKMGLVMLTARERPRPRCRWTGSSRFDGSCVSRGRATSPPCLPIRRGRSRSARAARSPSG